MVVMTTRVVDDGHVMGRLAVRDAPDVQALASDAGAVSWAAIVAGAAAAAALSLILLILGTGLGLSSVSPWSSAGTSAAAFGFSTILWIMFTQLAASGMGGYIAGRLRTKWAALHTDEVYFRDTAHGFLAWAVASLFTAALLSSAIASLLEGGVQTVATVSTGAAAAAGGTASAPLASSGLPADLSVTGYYVDTLFRNGTVGLAAAPDRATQSPAAAPTVEAARIFGRDPSVDRLPDEDSRYLAQLVSEHTGLAESAARQRVLDTYARMQASLHDASSAAKRIAEEARKASSYAALWLFVSLLCGAFVASLAATLGGRQRDL